MQQASRWNARRQPQKRESKIIYDGRDSHRGHRLGRTPNHYLARCKQEVPKAQRGHNIHANVSVINIVVPPKPRVKL